MKTIIALVSLIFLNSCNNISTNDHKNTVDISKKTNKTSESAMTAYQATNISMNGAKQIKEVIKKDQMKISKGLKVVYEERLNIPQEMIDKLPPEVRSQASELVNTPVKYQLLYNGNSASYKVDTNTSKSRSSESSNSGNSNSISLTERSTYKNYDKNVSIIKTGINNKTYLINEKLTEKNWEITDEYKIIGSYKCKKATSENENGTIIAYFTDQIPISEGPSIYGDLPGLIIYLEAADRNYKAVQIEFVDDVIVNGFTDGITVNRAEYEKLVVKYKDEKVVEQNVEIRN